MKKADGTNSPFTISSSISLEELCNTIADKLGRHDPSIVQLQYKLANDKAKALATSICDDDELQIFVEKMRALLAPPLLANGETIQACSTQELYSMLQRYHDGSKNDGKFG